MWFSLKGLCQSINFLLAMKKSVQYLFKAFIPSILILTEFLLRKMSTRGTKVVRELEFPGKNGRIEYRQ